MFSTSTMASSTTAPTAMTRPARTITLMVDTVAPNRGMISRVDISDRGMMVALINAVRHS